MGELWRPLVIWSCVSTEGSTVGAFWLHEVVLRLKAELWMTINNM
jgi:hypothetical protein